MKKYKTVKTTAIILLLATLFSMMALSRTPSVLAPVYRPHTQQIQMFKDLCNSYSSLADYETIGYTYEGREIIVCKFGNPNGVPILWDGSLHGWEDMGTETMYFLAEWLLSSSDAYATRIRERNYVLIIPVVNVDSEVRENANGVDLNRDFLDGTRQPETEAVKNAMNIFRPVFYVNVHVGGETIMWNGDSTDANAFSTEYTNALTSLGLSTASTYNGGDRYGFSSGGGGNGMAYGYAPNYGATGFLFEMYQASSWSDRPPLSTLENTYFPRLKAILVALCGACENGQVEPPENPVPPEEQVSTSARVQGQIIYHPAQLTSDLGWCGYITTEAEVIPLLDKLKGEGWNAIRYQSVPDWAEHDGFRVPIDYEILDHLVEEAEKRGMRVYLLCAHAWQPNTGEGGSGNFIDGHEQEWIDDYRLIAQRYAAHDIAIDAWSEYSSSEGKSRYQSLAQMFLDDFRAHGLNMLIHFNVWWNSPLFALNDPENNYSEGRHHYGGFLDDYNPSTPIDFETACEESGINDMMRRYFEENNNMYFQEALRLGIPYYVISEMGGSETPTEIYGGKYSMSVGNIAYAKKLLEAAKEKGVSCIMHRVGWLSDYDLYYQYSMEYFGESFF